MIIEGINECVKNNDMMAGKAQLSLRITNTLGLHTISVIVNVPSESCLDDAV
jgi:hypothetical protein